MHIKKKFLSEILTFILIFSNVNAGIFRSDRTNDWQAYILGGQEVRNISEFAYALSMRYIEFHICGASIIHPKWGLTAAHCFEDYFHPDLITLHGGSVNKFHGGKIIQVDEFILHPHFDDISYDNDVAVVRAKEDFLGENLKPVPLVGFNSFLRAGVVGVISGWGLLTNGNHPNNLQRLSLAVWNQKDCGESWKGKITSSMFCAGGEIGLDSCSGDSGGAMVVNGIQIGIISAGATDCGIAVPSVFVNLTSFEVRAFILETVGV